MKTLLTSIPILLITHSASMGEVEYQMHSGYSCEIICRWPALESYQPKVEHLGLPILITVCDEDRVPIPGAYVALKRLGPEGGYQESDIVSPDSSRSDKNGNAVVLHPHWPSSGIVEIVADPKKPQTETAEKETPHLKLIGAVTIVAEGYETQALELEQATEDAKLPDQSDVVPRFTVVLRRKAAIPAE